MIDKPLISVIMPTFNAAPFIQESIESVLNQSFTDFEFIIVDDCSTDNSIEIISSYNDARIVVIRTDINCGQTVALNKGIAKAKGRYIARMDADDISLPKRFELQYKYLEDNPEVYVLGTSFKIMDTNHYKNLVTAPEEIAVKIFLGQNCLAHPTVMMRNSVFYELGFSYNINNPVNQDFELWSEIVFNLKIANLSQILLEYRVHKDQISTKRRGEQLKHVSRILKNQILYFMPSASDAEMELHLKLTGFKSEGDTDLYKILSWGNKLKQHNKNSKKFNIQIYDQYIDKLCKNSTLNYFNKRYLQSAQQNPGLFINFIKDKLNYKYCVPLRTIMKFLIKCLLYKKARH